MNSRHGMLDHLKEEVHLRTIESPPSCKVQPTDGLTVVMQWHGDEGLCLECGGQEFIHALVAIKAPPLHHIIGIFSPPPLPPVCNIRCPRVQDYMVSRQGEQ